MVFGLGWPEWLTIIGLVGGLFLTFYVMVRGARAYERARERREQQAIEDDGGIRKDDE